MVLPTNLNPRRLKSLLMASDSGVVAGTSLLEALRNNGHPIPYSCESGTCGTCRVRFLDGEVDHRDLVLTDQERAKNMMVCVSRAFSPELVLDL